MPDVPVTRPSGPFIERRTHRFLRKLYAVLHCGLIDLDLYTLIRRVAQLMAVAFAGIILVSWVNEVYDLPYLMGFTGPSEPDYYAASIETLWAFFVLLLVLISMRALLKQIRYLEGFLPVCSFCKMIRLDDQTWVPVEQYLQERSAVKMTHSLCPVCAKKYYGYEEDEEREAQEDAG